MMAKGALQEWYESFQTRGDAILNFRFADQPSHGHHDGIAMDQCQDCWDKYYGIDRSTVTLAHLLNQGDE